MRTRKSILLFTVGLLLLTSALAGCGSSGNGADPSNSTGNSTSSGKDTASKDKMKLSFWSYNPERNKLDSPGVTAIKDNFGVDIEFLPVSSESYQEKLNLMISSGQIPDWMKEGNVADYEKYIKQNIIAEIPQDLIEQHMPKYMDWIKRFVDEEDPFKYVRRDGKIYSLPGTWDLGIDGLQLGFREDWLKNVGITEIPETIEEMEVALTKFRNEDPDGNGKKDTYGMTATG